MLWELNISVKKDKSRICSNVFILTIVLVVLSSLQY